MPKETVSGVKNQNAKQGNLLKSNPVFANYFKTDEPAKRPISETINKPVDQVMALVREVKNLPLFLEYLEKVEEGKGAKANWHFKSSTAGSKDVVIPVKFETIEGEGVAWKAEDAAGLSYSVAIQVLEAPAGRGTVVRMMTAYDSVLGSVAGVVEKLFGKDAEATSKKNLQRFKAFCETGHVPTIEGQSTGRDEDLIQTKH